MKPARMQLKSAAAGSLPAGKSKEALRLLSDSAFRLFMWSCLHASRNTGSLQVNAAQLARVLGKTPGDIVRDLQELVRARLCHVVEDQIVIQDRFWPYQRQSAYIDGGSAYVAAIKRAFLRHACVVSAFTPADEKLARDWERRGIPIETIERAILLGVARKYTACLNHGVANSITSLEYFAGVLIEIKLLSCSANYFAYLAQKVQAMEAAFQHCRSSLIKESTETK